MKRIRKITALILLTVLSVFGLFACKKEPDPVQKPAIAQVLTDYYNAPKKRSVYDASFTMQLYTALVDGNITFGQKLSLDRILNDGKIYSKAELKSHNVSSRFLGFVNLILKTAGGNDLSSDVFDYVKGDKKFAGDFSSVNGSYNLRGVFLDKNETADFNKYKTDGTEYAWLATSNDYIDVFLADLGYGVNVKLSDWLMFSTPLEFDGIDWINGDSADTVLGSDGLFQYRMTLDPEKVKAAILSQANEIAADMDQERHRIYLELYEDIMPTVMNWVKVESGTVNATASAEGKLLSIDSAIRAHINVVFDELRVVLRKLIIADNKVRLGSAFNPQNPITAKQQDDINSIISLAQWALRDKNLQQGKATFTFDIATSDRISYDESAVSFASVPQDMLIPAGTSAPGREIWNGRQVTGGKR